MHRVNLIRFFSVVALVLFAGLVQAQECVDCHDDVELTSPVHGGFDCTDCHSDITEYPHPEEMIAPPAMCENCHSIGEGMIDGPHVAIGCSGCHGPAHQVIPSSESDSPVSKRNQIETCGGCHEDYLIDNYLQSVHGRGLLESGLEQAATCASCHTAHEIFPPEDPRSSVSWSHIPETCAQCHVYILETWQNSAHGKAWKDGNESAPVCATCHSSHLIQEPGLGVARLAVPTTCGECHTEQAESYHDSFHGKASELGWETVANCADCHTPHLNLPPDDPSSSVHPDNLQATCGECHDDITPGFISFDPHLDPTDPNDNTIIYWIWLSMTSLLIGTFGFFGIHDLLWLQRVIVALSRGEQKRPSLEEKWVRRFKSHQVKLHIVVIVSFLLLALTGIPLHFHYTDWGKMLNGAFGGVGFTSVIHRIAAFVTFGYFLFHVVYLVVRGLGGDRQLLWGRNSMVPQPHDLGDFWANLKYFLYLGPQPRFGRWTYWEKFDYFAVFWGMIIIGGSGAFLWFPEFVTRWLPGWVLNAATIVHGDEALLAVGFIFIFHFFHTHLRPEIFPLDPSIFVGSMPLERFKEERPDEYERLVASGKFEERLVDPPTQAQLHKARIFGFTAVAIGVMLVIAMIVAVASHL